MNPKGDQETTRNITRIAETTKKHQNDQDITRGCAKVTSKQKAAFEIDIGVDKSPTGDEVKRTCDHAC